MKIAFKDSNLNNYASDDLRLIEARKSVAAGIEENAYAVREEDAYADHVTECQKEENLMASIALAKEVERGEHDNSFWCWQRINLELTGECTAFLP
jgi:hypothetical protein